jgi:hypothetical protein
MQLDENLSAFYEDVFGPELELPLPRHVEVEDIESTLTKVWDAGGTIISAPQPDLPNDSPLSASFRDPRGNLVSIFAGREAARLSRLSAPRRCSRCG